jgi:hypothetical protein
MIYRILAINIIFSEDGGGMFLRNVGSFSTNYAA